MALHAMSAEELTKLLDRGEITSADIVQALRDRADAVEPEVNALAHALFDEALEQARLRDRERQAGHVRGPLHGVPLTVKESIDTSGLASTLGLLGRRELVAERDAVVVQLAREAGAIVVAKTNVPQSLLSPMETTNFLFGTTNNPWDLARGPGGSSGGEAAAIASGTSVLGIGTDIGGSIRIPAAHCGIAGLKPTTDRWSNLGANTAILGQETIRSQVGPMARTVSDLALLLRALDSPAHSPRDPRVPPLPIGNPDDIDVSRLTIGFYDDDRFFTPSPAIRRGVQQAARDLEREGATVVSYTPSTAQEEPYLYIGVLSSDGGRTLDRMLAREAVIEPLKTLRLGAKMSKPLRLTLAAALRARGERRIATLLSSIGQKSVAELWTLTARRLELQLDEQRAWDRAGIDAVVCPAHATLAVPHGVSHDFTLSFCYAARYNLLGFPAGTVPVTRARPSDEPRANVLDRLDRKAALVEDKSAGLPVSVQVVARPYREDVALAVMAAIERTARLGDDYPITPVDPSRR